MSEATNQVLEEAFEEAEKFKDEYVSAEHILLAIAARGIRSRPGSCWRATALPAKPFCRR